MNKRKIISSVIIAFTLIFISVIFNPNAIEVKAATNEKKTFFQKISEKIEMKKINRKISKAKKAINKKKYNKALEILSPLALNNNENKEAIALYTMVNNYQKALKAMEEDHVKIAKDLLEEIDSSYGTYKIGQDIEELKTKIQFKEAEEAEINSIIDTLNKKVEEKKYDEAKSLIAVLNKKNLNEYQVATVDAVSKNIDEDLVKIEEEKRLEEERQKAEAERAEEARIKQEQEAAAVVQNSTQNTGSSSNYNSSNNNYSNSNNNSDYNQASGSYYIAAGNRYYHNTPSCKFLEGAATTLVSDVSNKFPCNCVKY